MHAISVRHAQWEGSSRRQMPRHRIGELMADDDDQRQVDRVMSRTTSGTEVEIPRPEAGEEVDVGEPTIHVAGPMEEQPVPTVRVGGSSGSGTRPGNTDDRETKHVRIAQSRGQKRQGEDVKELAAKAEEQHLDGSVRED